MQSLQIRQGGPLAPEVHDPACARGRQQGIRTFWSGDAGPWGVALVQKVETVFEERHILRAPERVHVEKPFQRRLRIEVVSEGDLLAISGEVPVKLCPPGIGLP